MGACSGANPWSCCAAPRVIQGRASTPTESPRRSGCFEMPATGLPQGGEIKSERCRRIGATLHGHIDCAPARRDVMGGPDRPTLRRRLASPPWRRCPWAEARSTLHDRRGRPSRAAYAAPLKATRCGATHPDSRGGASPLLVAEPLPVSERAAPHTPRINGSAEGAHRHGAAHGQRQRATPCTASPRLAAWEGGTPAGNCVAGRPAARNTLRLEASEWWWCRSGVLSGGRLSE